MTPEKHLALFENVDQASEAIAKLRQMGVSDNDISVVSGVPFKNEILGRPAIKTHVPLFAMIGFAAGFVVSLLLNWGTPLLYPIRVGGQPLLPIPTTIVLTFEISMLGLLIFTFLGVIWENGFPSFGKHDYHPAVADGKIAVFFAAASDSQAKAYDTMKNLGASEVQRAEAKTL